MTEKKQIMKSASVVPLAPVLSRIFGHARERRTTLLLSVSPPARAFVEAYSIAGALRGLLVRLRHERLWKMDFLFLGARIAHYTAIRRDLCWLGLLWLHFASYEDFLPRLRIFA